MHPYSVWLKHVLNSMIKDVRYSYCKDDAHVVCVQLFLKIVNIIKIEINDQVITSELDRLFVGIDSDLVNAQDKEGAHDMYNDLRLSDEISVYLGALEYDTDKLSIVFSKCKDLISESKHLDLEIKKCFDSRALTGLMSVPSVGSNKDAYYIMTEARNINNEAVVERDTVDAIIPEKHDDRKLCDDPGKPQNDPIMSTWKPAGIIFFILLISFLSLIYHYQPKWVNYLDATVTALLIATAIWFFLNPKTRYFRMFVILQPFFVTGQGLAYSINAGHYQPNSELAISISNAALDWVVQVIVGVISVVLLVLDYLERKRA